MRKERLNNIIRSQASFQSGRITAVNSDGSFSVQQKGRTYSMLNVGNNTGLTFAVGDCVSLGMLGGDQQKPTIIGYSGFYSAETTEEIAH